MITNGFTYIAFLIFLAGMLLFLEKKTKAKILTLCRRWSGFMC